jgi:hypothetical protein
MSDDPNITVSKASPMLQRLLNISSIVCLVACVALMGMWVRSYWWADRLYLQSLGFQRGVALAPGQVVVGSAVAHDPKPLFMWSSTRRATYQEYWISSDEVKVPYWFLVLTIGSLAMLFQLRWPMRFTLRGMFVLTTFPAVVLGMIAWLDRAWIGK